MACLEDTTVYRAAQRLAHQPPRARCTGRLQKSHDLAREAVGWMRVFGGNAVFGNESGEFTSRDFFCLSIPAQAGQQRQPLE
jgi:hypothetical protein